MHQIYWGLWEIYSLTGQFCCNTEEFMVIIAIDLLNLKVNC